MTTSERAESTSPSAHRRLPEFELLKKYAPGYDQARRVLSGLVYAPSEGDELPVKVREMILAAVLCVRGYPTVEDHFRRALDAGATMKELVEAMICAAHPGGMPTLHHALVYLNKIEAERAGA